MQDAVQAWVEATLAGFRALSASRHGEAASHWLAAYDILRPMAQTDPRVAASQTNAGAARLLLRQGEAAETLLVEAELSWMRILAGIAAWDVPITGHSSSFHFTLASRNLQAFRNAQRRRYTRQCEAALAITRFNLLLAGATPGACTSIAPVLAAQLSDILGPRAPEVRLLRAAEHPSAAETGQSDSIYADIVAEHAQRHASASIAVADDFRALEAGVSLTALLRPGLLHGAQHRPHRVEAGDRSDPSQPAKRSSTR